MDKSNLDRPTLIFIGSVVALGFFGTGLIAGSVLNQSRPPATVGSASATATAPEAQSSPSLGSSPSPMLNQIPTNDSPLCSFADFPFYPGSDNYHVSPPMQNAWYVNQPTAQVASYFAGGAYQHRWTFVAGPSATVVPGSSVMSYKFRFTRAPACRGELRIFPESLLGASVYQATPDAP